MARSFCIGSESPRSSLPPSLARRPSESFRAWFDQLAQVRDVERLRHEVECTEFQRAHRGLDVAMRGDHGDRQVRGVVLDPFQQLDAVAVRKTEVRQAQGVVLLRLQFAPRGGQVVHGIRVDVHARERQRQELAEVRFIVDDQCPRVFRGHQDCSQRMRIRKHDPEYAAATCARLEHEQRAIALCQLARDEEAKSRPAGTRRKEWLEDPVGQRRVDARAAIQNLEEWPVTAGQPPDAQFDAVACVLHCVSEGVFAEIPEDLAQVRWINPHLEVRFGRLINQLFYSVVAGDDEFLGEVGQPLAKRHALGARGLAPCELLHIADDRAHPLGIGLDDLGHAAAGFRKRRILRQQLPGMADRADRDS